MLLPKLDWKSSKPVSLQLQEQVREHLASGSLRVGERLPSTRRLAELLGIHRSTVALAYQELWAQGWIDQRPGSAPRVRARLAAAVPASGSAPEDFDWAGLASRPAREALEIHRDLGRHSGRAGAINFANLHMDPRLFPAEEFRACMARAMKRAGTSLLTYGDYQGYRPLREFLARRMALHGVETSAEEILVTSGSQQALDLMLRMLARPGGSVAVESPTYSLFLPLLRLKGMRALEIPYGPDGMDLRALEAALERERPLLVYTMPNFQNPTGRSASQAGREGLLDLCTRHGVPILEDGFEEEMKYFGRAIPPLKAMDRRGLVVYCGSFSKILFAGIRVGWIVAPRACLEQLMALRHFSEIMPSMLPHAALHEFCERGLYDLHVSRMHRVYRKRMQAALLALRRHIDPTWARWEEPNGGYLIWLDLKAPGPRRPRWQELFEAEGVRISPGNQYSPSGNHSAWIRLSISLLDEGEIEEGLRRLGSALAKVHAGA
ncbi:MAG TPA: PLP-dependent aminotransferase family protein [Holophaga sp.]|nr:PLP-dependent aminotransferase family protein [Holophaga sp.]HPS68559.1 PLP-dependent aminotransferase family protein [Holophaga sp.]